MWIKFFCVGCGGFLGAMLRYAVVVVCSHFAWVGWVPTFLVNLIGCFTIGFLFPLFNVSTEQWRLFIIVGILGGFTTFSTFSLDALLLYTSRGVFAIISYMTLTVFCCLLAVWGGYKLNALCF